jgi:hypothetical protein
VARSTDLQGPTTTPNSSLQLALAIGRVDRRRSRICVKAIRRARKHCCKPALTMPIGRSAGAATVATIQRGRRRRFVVRARRDRPARESTLAHRLDVVERFFMPTPC